MSKAASESADAHKLVFRRVVDAPRELVFDAWTDPKHIGRWWGPHGFTTTTHVMEVRVGGRWDYVMHGPDGTNYPNESVYREVRRPERLTFSNAGGAVDDPHLTCQMSVTFEDIRGKTKLTLRMRFPSVDAVRRAKAYGVEDGGMDTLDRLAELMHDVSTESLLERSAPTVRS